MRKLSTTVILGLVLACLAVPAFATNCEGRTKCNTTTTSTSEPPSSTTTILSTTTTEQDISTTTLPQETTTTLPAETTTVVGESTTTSLSVTTLPDDGIDDPCSTKFEDECFPPQPELPFTGISRFTWMTMIFVASVSGVLGFMLVMGGREE